ncbi:hypothetical protein MMPV_002503 [Pyropia vietnamensis]
MGAPARGDMHAASTARLIEGLTDAKVITLAEDCGGECQASVSKALTSRGCSSIAVLPTLRMVTAVCAKTAGEAAETVNAETAKIPGVLDVEDDSLVTGTKVDEEDREGDPIIPITDGNGKPYFWGLDRINQYQLPLDMNIQTQCYPKKGDGVEVFVVDSGCMVNHPEFSGVKIRSMALESSPYDPAGIDDRGHGSHVAGTVAGARTGVAPGSSVTCIKVLNDRGRGKSSDVAAGFEYVAAYKAANPGAKVIMQASLGGSGNHHNTVMRRMAGVGVIGSVAAGNDGGDACDHTPAGSPDVITAGNMDIDDSVWRSSNIGRCVDVFAPGHKILSVDIEGTLTTKTGTSMAAPHVSGIIALILANHPNGASLDVNAVKALLTAGAPMITDHPLAWASPSCNGSAPAPPAPMPGMPAPMPGMPAPMPGMPTPVPGPKGPGPAPVPMPNPGAPAPVDPPCQMPVPAPGAPAPAPGAPAPAPGVPAPAPGAPAPAPAPVMYPGGIPPEGSPELPQMPPQ